MWDRVWDMLVDTMRDTFLPLVCSYFAITSSVFVNTADLDATGFEKLGNTILVPTQYILAGRTAKQLPDGTWRLTQRFDYKDGFWLKVVPSLFALPPSFIFGCAVKGLGLLNKTVRNRYTHLTHFLQSDMIRPNSEAYRSMGLEIGQSLEWLKCEGHQRRPGDEKNLLADKEALRDITTLLTKAQISWWVDCGTCLGAYRYGGVIPWDCDIDIAVLLPDFQNVCHALNQLDPNKYIVQNWSSREHPDSYLKVYNRESNTLIDIYHFKIHPETKQLEYILALENNIFFPEWWRIRERRFKVPVAFETVFPLKKAMFDGIEVFVPNDTKKYLQRYYGENLDPAKVYDPVTGQYEKDLSHPYWQREFAH